MNAIVVAHSLVLGQEFPGVAAYVRGETGKAPFSKDRRLDKHAFARLETVISGAGRFGAAERRFEGAKGLTVTVTPPSSYRPGRPTPLILAFGGGPVPVGERGDEMTAAQARMMTAAWRKAAEKAGWLLAAVQDDISRSKPGIRYEIVRPAHLEQVLKAIRQRFNVDEDRTFMTGISLGSNYALACGAARPHLFCGAAPVSTEGEGRPDLLSNLRNYPLYVLVGARDKNIRGIAGPRALDAILTRLGYGHRYEEFADRAHEGFKERYGDILKWFAARPRNFWAAEVVRVPHRGIMAPDRAFYWIGCDTRQGAFRARVSGNTIDVDAAALTRLEILLSDRLLDLDRPVKVRVNGTVLHDARVKRDPLLAVEHARRTFDRRQVPAARIVVAVPDARASRPTAAPEAELALWEFYALRHLRETRKLLGLSGKTESLGKGRVGLRTAGGKLVTAFESNPFFSGDDVAALIDLWCLRQEYAGPEPKLTRE